MNKKELEKKTRAYALKNAVAHDGKANPGSVISSLFHEGLKKEDVKKYIKEISKIVANVNKLSLEEQKREFEELEGEISERKVREGLPELPGAKKGKVIMRIAPSPSGPLHVGHAMTACLSFLFVKKYGGKFYVRIEDTNPENIYSPAYKMIKDEAKWLFDNTAEFVVQSERMEVYYKYAEKLIKKNAVYVCTCSADGFKKFVSEKKDCPCRKLSIKENLDRWRRMLDKNGFKEGGAVLRFKSSMKGKNPAMRDFPLARINLTEHALQKKKYRVWPLMNFAVAVDDIEMKTTHVIRAKDHRDNAKRQEMIFKNLGKRFPWTAFLGRWHFKDFELSSSKMRKNIEEKKYSGWDDSQLPTIASLKKQGYKPHAFWKFAERVGFSETDKVIDREEYYKLLDYFNK
ncbi:MAG: glutamate--tRNA ligase family protein [archaeon]